MTQEKVVAHSPELTLVDPCESYQAHNARPESGVIHLDDYRQAGLPGEAYTSDRYLQQERETVFQQYWVCVGLASDAPNPGDVYPTEVAGMPIVLVRDRAGTLRAFHNVCSHRGLQLVNAPCNVSGHLRCPYHSWTYKLDGKLKNTPHFGGYYQDTYEGFDRDSKGLKSIRCDQWLDLVFVNLSGDAPPLTEYLQPMIDRWSVYDLSELRREPARWASPATPIGSWRWKTFLKAIT
jgi:choline monooxygenase